jgi:hypothetical protein
MPISDISPVKDPIIKKSTSATVQYIGCSYGEVSGVYRCSVFEGGCCSKHEVPYFDTVYICNLTPAFGRKVFPLTL